MRPGRGAGMERRAFLAGHEKQARSANSPSHANPEEGSMTLCVMPCGGRGPALQLSTAPSEAVAFEAMWVRGLIVIG